MKHIPFLAFPAAEQEAVRRLLRTAGIAPAGVCVSRLELPGPRASREPSACTTVSTPAWVRTYCSTPECDWLPAFERELA